MALLEQLNEVIWCPWMLGLFLMTGLWCSVRSGWFQLRGFQVWWRATAGSLGRLRGREGAERRRGLSAALASVVGTGSVAGVAAAIQAGGPGAVFWMWISALVGMMTGYVEKALAVRYRAPGPAGSWQGGPMYYLTYGVGSPVLGWWFAAACLPAALTGGCMVQANAINDTLEHALGWPPMWGAGLVAAAALAAAMGGFGAVSRVCVGLTPIMAGLYLIAGGAVLCLRAEYLPDAVSAIVHGAFTGGPWSCAAGGGAWAAVRYGIARGVFTNEAGMGTSAIAHAASGERCPVRQGMWGIFEVFASTMVVCTVTALVVLTGGMYQDSAISLESAALAVASFRKGAGAWAGAAVSVCLVLFALSSLLGWSCYGAQAAEYLTGQSRAAYWPWIFAAAALAGSLGSGKTVWQMVDLSTALMALPNLMGILILSNQTIGELRIRQTR